MKKSIIATGAAAVALAAMPVLGAFADVTDTVVLTIKSSCTVGSSTATSGAGKTMTENNAVNSHLYTFNANGTDGGTLKITCNNASGWTVSAVGSSTGSVKNVMVPTNTAASNAIQTGTDESGADSQWMFKVAGTGAVAAYTSWHEIPDAGSPAVVAESNTSASEQAINTGYQVWVSATQPADTYTGSVTYTVAPKA